MATIKIDIIADTVCPFCYVALKQVGTAISAYRTKYPTSKDQFEINWKPFFLQPDAPTKGVNKQQFMLDKFGPVVLAKIEENFATMGKQNGISFKSGGNTGNTLSSHRLLNFAGTKSSELQNKVAAELYEGYFEREKDITSIAFLLESAKKAGLDEQEAKKWLEDGKGEEEVKSAAENARSNGVKSVPNITVGGIYPVGDQRDVDSFLGLFDRVVKSS